uniref:Uncharacterized protein n=1 Tax=Romanomermis culicivorax TaxID=13658 RepID=A0A915KSD6_ROMCU
MISQAWKDDGSPLRACMVLRDKNDGHNRNHPTIQQTIDYFLIYALIQPLLESLNHKNFWATLQLCL